MKYFLALMSIFLIIGCGNNASEGSKPSFTISLAPSRAPILQEPIPVNAQLILTASVALDPATVNENTIIIQDETATNFPITITLDGPDLSIKPKVYLTPNTNYFIRISKNVRSAQGKQLLNDITINFTSAGPDPDQTPPSLQTTLPLNNASLEPFAKIYFQFDEAISPLSIDNSVLNVFDNNTSTNVEGTIKVSGALLTFTPKSQLIVDHNYTATLELGNGTLTHSISDLAGNPHPGGTQILNFQVKSSLISNAPNLATPTYSLYSDVYAIEAIGTTLFVGGAKGLKIISHNLTNASFTPISELTRTQVGSVYSIELNASTKRAYIGTSNGVSIVDISNLATPTIIGSYKTQAPVYGLKVKASHLYLAASLQGVIDLDIQNETAPTERFVQDTNGTAFDVAINSNFIIVADFNEGIKLFDTQGNLFTTLNTNGQTRNLIDEPFGSENQLVSSGIGGINYVETLSTPTAYTFFAVDAYVNKIRPATLPHDTNPILQVNLYGIGIAQTTPEYIINSYIPLDFNVVNFVYLKSNDETISHMIVVDETGTLRTLIL